MRPSDAGMFADDWSDSFENAVRHAYFVDHGIEEDQEIAAKAGKSGSALSQQFAKSPLLMKGGSLASLLRPIRVPELRDEIVLAWSRKLMAEQPVPDLGTDWRQEAKQLVARDRPDLALRMALREFEADRSPEDRWEAFKQAISCCFRLDLPGESIRLCGKLREWGDRDDIPVLDAVAHAAGSRAMRRTTLFGATQVAEERQRAESLLLGMQVEAGLADPDLLKQMASYAKALVLSEQINDVLRLQDLNGNKEKEILEILETVYVPRQRAAKTAAGRARNAQLAARAFLALRRPDEAEPYVRQAMEEGERDPSVRLECEHLLGRLLAERGRADEALVQLGRAARESARRHFIYLGRVIESEIVRIEFGHPARTDGG